MKHADKKKSSERNGRRDSIPLSNLAIVVIAILASLVGLFFISYREKSEEGGFGVLGILACVSGVVLIAYVIGANRYQNKERQRLLEKEEAQKNGLDSPVLRVADASLKCKILLERTVGEYHIAYRRVKSVNELVINGSVYDEKKGIIELAHELSAFVGGHTICAGLDAQSCSYLSFDGKRIAQKRRVV